MRVGDVYEKEPWLELVGKKELERLGTRVILDQSADHHLLD